MMGFLFCFVLFYLDYYSKKMTGVFLLFYEPGSPTLTNALCGVKEGVIFEGKVTGVK